MRFAEIRFVASGLILAGCLSGQTRSRAVADDEEQIKRLTVFMETDGSYGAGIIVATGGTTVYIATAAHVLRPMADSKSLKVTFYPDGDVHDAAIEHLPALGDVDIAAISVKDKQFQKRLHFDCVGVARFDYDVYMVGHPNHRLWEVSGKPDAVVAVKDGEIQFQSALVMRGNSGGSLIANNLRLLVGMVVSQEPPHGEAIEISTLIATLSSWKIPVMLSTASIDRFLEGLK